MSIFKNIFKENYKTSLNNLEFSRNVLHAKVTQCIVYGEA